MLDTTVESVTSALKRARATFGSRPGAGDREPPPLPNSPAEAELAARLTQAYETGDVDGLVALLTQDVWVTMPPVPLQYQGLELAARFHTAVTFRQDARINWFRPAPTGSSPSAPTCATRAAGRATPWACWCSRSPGTGSAPSPGSTTAFCSASGSPAACPADQLGRGSPDCLVGRRAGACHPGRFSHRPHRRHAGV